MNEGQAKYVEFLAMFDQEAPKFFEEATSYCDSYYRFHLQTAKTPQTILIDDPSADYTDLEEKLIKAFTELYFTLESLILEMVQIPNLSDYPTEYGNKFIKQMATEQGYGFFLEHQTYKGNEEAFSFSISARTSFDDSYSIHLYKKPVSPDDQSKNYHKVLPKGFYFDIRHYSKGHRTCYKARWSHTGVHFEDIIPRELIYTKMRDYRIGKVQMPERHTTKFYKGHEYLFYSFSDMYEIWQSKGFETFSLKDEYLGRFQGNKKSTPNDNEALRREILEDTKKLISQELRYQKPENPTLNKSLEAEFIQKQKTKEFLLTQKRELEFLEHFDVEKNALFDSLFELRDKYLEVNGKYLGKKVKKGFFEFYTKEEKHFNKTGKFKDEMQLGQTFFTTIANFMLSVRQYAALFNNYNKGFGTSNQYVLSISVSNTTFYFNFDSSIFTISFLQQSSFKYFSEAAYTGYYFEVKTLGNNPSYIYETKTNYKNDYDNEKSKELFILINTLCERHKGRRYKHESFSNEYRRQYNIPLRKG